MFSFSPKARAPLGLLVILLCLCTPTLQKIKYKHDSIVIEMYEKPGCKGFGEKEWYVTTVYQEDPDVWPEPNVTKGMIFKSFRMSRNLGAQEQLDISVHNNLARWEAGKGEERSADERDNCWVWKRSFYAGDKIDKCTDVPASTCFRLWDNLGIGKDF